MKEQIFFLNKYHRVFTVKFMYDLTQPFICGTFEEILKHATTREHNGIEGFFELTGYKVRKVSKKELKTMIAAQRLYELGEKLFKIY